MSEINLDEINQNSDDHNVEVKYHDSLPITYNPKEPCYKALIPTLGLDEIRSGNTLRAGLIELIGEIQFVLGSCLIANGVQRTQVPYGFVYSSILHVFLFMFMVSSTIPASGGHLNPLITMACVFTRVMSVGRALVYIVCQVIGATIAGFLVRMMVGEDVATSVGIGECGIGQYADDLGPAAAFLVEYFFDFVLLFVLYGMVIDPRQNETAGPIFGPLVVAFIFCFLFVVGGLIRPESGYGGAAMNPARCLGPAIAIGKFTNIWVFWIPPICAAISHGILYILVPPYHANLYGKLDLKRKKLNQ